MDEVQLQLKNLRTYFLVAGIANLVAFLVGAITVIVVGIGTMGCGCLLGILPIINLGVMVFDFVAHSRSNQPPSPQLHGFLRMCAIFDMVAFFALVPLIMGILNLQILARPDVHAHFHGEREKGA